MPLILLYAMACISATSSYCFLIAASSSICLLIAAAYSSSCCLRILASSMAASISI